MNADLESLKQSCALWATEIKKMREELVRAEKLFSDALESQRARIEFAEEQLRVSQEGIKHFGETTPLAEIMSSIMKPAPVSAAPTIPDDLQSILKSEGSTSSKSKRLGVYILEMASRPLRNREIVDEHDRLGLKTGPTPEEVMASEPDKRHTLASAEKRSFTLKWGLIRKAFDDRVVRLDNDTYWLKDHPRGKA